MQKSTPSQQAPCQSTSKVAQPPEAYRESAAACREAQTTSKNPVILALRGIERPRLDTGSLAADKAKIAKEVIERLGRSNAAASKSSDGIAVRALRESQSVEQASRIRAELEAYLAQSEKDDQHRAHRPRQEIRRAHDSLLRDPVLAALFERRGSNREER